MGVVNHCCCACIEAFESTAELAPVEICRVMKGRCEVSLLHNEPSLEGVTQRGLPSGK